MERTRSVMNSIFQNSALLCLLFLAIALLTHKIVVGRRRNPLGLPLPPGPKGYPLIGNFFDMPTSQQWLTYACWAKVYGDVLSFEVFGQRIIILNSLEAAQDLFEKRSANYSDRPRLTMLLELMDFGHILALLPYGSWWRRHRRTFSEHFRAQAVGKYQSIQAREVIAFLNRLLESPEKFNLHTREALASAIMHVTYGIKIKGSDDPYVTNIEASIEGLNLAAHPASFLVDLIPALKHMPGWFPGAGFKKKADYWRKMNQKVVELPFNHVVQEMKNGTAGPSVAATLISALPEEGKQSWDEERKIAQNVTSVAYIGGGDTTVSAIQTFFLAMATHPEAQIKAQRELDTVIGPQRLPELRDRSSLPYVNALIKETMRWQLVTPLGLGHMATNDDVYNGYFIPKGSIVIGNSWAILHDEGVFTDPEEYLPERYLKDGQLDFSVRQPEVGAFGFGRRICPGRFFSDNMLFLMISSTLHTFNVTPSLDEEGVPIPLSGKMTTGTVSYPEPFKVDIKPRSSSAEILVKEAIMGVDR